jgi:lysophospholipase L1-like esterase
MFTDAAGYGFGQYLSRYGQIALVTTNGVTTAISEPDDRPLGNSSFSIVCPLSGNAIPYINGHGPTGMLATGGCPAFDTTGTVYIGDDALIPGAFSWAGKIYAMLVYPTALTAQQISQNHNYITSQLAQNGVGAFVDKIAPYALIYQGDSRTANQGSQDSLTDSRGYYISQLQPGREQFYNFGVSGISLSTIISNLPMNEYPVLQTFPSLSKTVLIDAGINDITNGAASGATVYGYMQTYCADIHANSPGSRVIAATIYGNAYFGNTVPIGYEVTGREAYNADLIAGALAGTLNCDGVDDEADDPIAATQISPNNFNTTASVFPTGLTNHVTPGSFNPTWTVDGIHLTGAGNKELSTLESFALLAGQGRADKCTLVNFQIPWQVVQSANAVTPSLAQTIPLTQLFTGWQMCGQPSVHVTTAYVGTTTLTISIGDSTGSATQYLGATSLKSTGTTLGSTAAFVSADGVVQLTFTATGTNLNTVSAGNAIIQIGLQVRP